MVAEAVRLTGDEVVGWEPTAGYQRKLVDFWRWALGDLRANDVRGMFAEWLVARVLDVPLTVRDSWAAWDLETVDGVKIDVKAAAYLQTWPQQRPSPIIFTGFKGRIWTPGAGDATEATYNADVYVFCVQTEQDAAKWNALDMGQWRFYLLSKKEVVDLNRVTISLGVLRTLTPELTIEELRPELLRMCAAAHVGGSQ